MEDFVVSLDLTCVFNRSKIDRSGGGQAIVWDAGIP